MALSDEFVKLARTALDRSNFRPTWRQRLLKLEREMARHAGKALRGDCVTSSLGPSGHLRGEVVRLRKAVEKSSPKEDWPEVSDADFELWSEIVSLVVPRARWYCLCLKGDAASTILEEARDATNDHVGRVAHAMVRNLTRASMP